MNKFQRKDGFLGIHFDFHAKNDDVNIGNDFTESMVQNIINLLKPDYIQCDTKGAFGLTSYPTKLGNCAPGVSKDILKIWRKVTRRNNVGLFAHYAAIDDIDAIQKHPEWALIRSDGTHDKRLVSIPSGYFEEKLIPQLCELAGDYDLDGAWMDGSAFNVTPDYGPEILQKFSTQTGIKDVPVKVSDKNYQEFIDFYRNEYRKIRKYYIDRVHEKYPDFQICCNWDYTTYDPEIVDSDVSFISADVWGINTFNILRMEGRFVSQKGIPWDMMLWSGSAKYEGGYVNSIKPPIQLVQEACEIIAQGGGVELYISQERNGSVDISRLETFKKVFEFCQKYRTFLFSSKSASQIAVLFSEKNAMKKNKNAFGFFESNVLDGVNGIMQCLVESQISVDVIGEWQLQNLPDRYKLIVVPEWNALENKDLLLSFIAQGGNVIVIGCDATNLFSKELSVKVTNCLSNQRVYIGDKFNRSSFGSVSDFNIVETVESQIVEKVCLANPNIDLKNKKTGVTISNYGNGKICGIYFDIGHQYICGRTTEACNFMKRAVERLIEKPTVKVIGSRYLEVVERIKDSKREIVLINCSGPHSDPTVFTYDEILPLHNVQVMIYCDKKPNSIMLQPEGNEISFLWNNDTATVVIDTLEIMSVLIVESI